VILFFITFPQQQKARKSLALIIITKKFYIICKTKRVLKKFIKEQSYRTILYYPVINVKSMERLAPLRRDAG
jgi:hypothetical protein